VESLALFCLVVFVHVHSLLQLVTAMGEGTGVSILTGAVQLPKLTYFRLEFQFEALSWLSVSVARLLSNSLVL
jgi:hypothetical protein